MYTLKAMQYGSKTAARQVPRLLQIADLYPDTLDNFKKKVSTVSLQNSSVVCNSALYFVIAIVNNIIF